MALGFFGLVGSGAALAQTPTVPATAVVGGTVAGGTKVHGTITDPDGALIPGATITLTPVKGAPVKVVSGGDGTYVLTATPGVYTLKVTMPGFASFSAANVKIPAVASTTLDAKMQIGEETQVVNVSSDAIQLSVDPDSNSSATVITGKDLEALSDDPDELSSELSALAGPSAGPNGGQIYVDGFTGGQLPPKSSIREIRINQNPFSAQYDKLGYGRIEVFTKPGTDKIHGSLQLNGNPSQFNTSTQFENGLNLPAYHTIFGFGSLTGPINKSASYSLGGSYRNIQDDALTNASIVALPGTTTLCDPSTVGCVEMDNTRFSTKTPQTRFDFTPRIDLALGEKNVLTTRLQYEQNDQDSQGIGGLKLPSLAYSTHSKDLELQVSDTQTISSRLINETRFEYEIERSNTVPGSNAASVGVSGAFNSGGYGGQSSNDHQDHIELQNYTSLQLKKNFIRFGGRLRSTREALNTQAGTNGSFTYTSLAAYQANMPSQFSLTQVHAQKIGDTFVDLGLYAESDWKVKPNLTVSYGLRYETQNHLADHHDFAPRMSISYGLFSGKGAPKTVLRGGFGLFYDRFGQGNILTLQQQNGTNETVYTVQNPTGCTPTGFNPKTFTPGATTGCGAGATTASLTRYTAADNLRTPYTTQVAVGADQQVFKFGTVSVNLIHSQGVHQLATQNVGYNVTSQTSPNGYIYQYFTGGVFNQNQMTINGRVQTGKRVSLFGYYALSSAHGDTSGNGSFVTTPYNIAADYGRTGFDVRQRIFLGGSVTLPKFVQLSPFVIGQSGNPYNVTTGSDDNNDSIYNDRPYLVGAGTPQSKTIAGCGTFVARSAGAISSDSKIVPINYCTGPALFTLNFRLTKTFGFGPSTKKDAGGSQSGGGGRGGPGGGGGRGGGGPMFGGGGTSTGQRYNLGVGLQVQNLFANSDLATPQSALSAPNFGQSTQVTGGPYTSNAASRRISLQASFTF